MGKRTDHYRKTKRKKKKKIFFKTKILLALCIVFGVSVLMLKLYEPKMEAQINQPDPIVNEVVSAVSGKVKVDNQNDLIVTPVGMEPRKGLILYPETEVSPEAYIPLVTKLAGKGYSVVIPKFLFNNPTIDVNKVNSIISENATVNLWAVGGHGDGGVLASKTLLGNKKIKGAFFLASYPDESVNIADSGLKAISICGSKDNLLDKNKYNARKSSLPQNTVYTVIENGNHSYFGNYQNENTGITEEEQQIQTVVQLVNLMDELREST